MVRNIAVLIPESTQNDITNTLIPIFPGKDIFIGRDEDACFPFIQSSIVSKVHFRLYSVTYDEDQLADYPPLVYCTFKSPRSPYLLNNGDIISIRPHWTFRFQQAEHVNSRKLDDLQTQEIKLFKDRYTISPRLLGSGVYGKVFLANDVLTQKQLACKVVDLRKTVMNSTRLQEEVGTATWKKQMREIEFLSKLSHPNIATLYQAFRTPHSLYMFNELATGGDLYSFLQANGSFLEDLHARIISRQIAIALEYLHANGIAHRDLKPENVLVMRTGIGHRVVLTDFGCAGYMGGDCGRMMSTVGTYDYVAPEVHKPQSRGYTEAIDMWSLGVVTLCLLTGCPFVSFEDLQTMNQADIAAKLNEAGHEYPQWSMQAKDFINKLVLLDPLKRMRAAEAVDHDWFRKPARIAVELDKLYERSISFWSKRSNYIGIIEDLPNVIPEFIRPTVRSSKDNDAQRQTIPKRMLDATSPYFSLDRHLHPKGSRARSGLRSQQKRILQKLSGASSQFIDDTTQSLQIVASKMPKVKSSSGPLSDICDTDVSDFNLSLCRPAEPSCTSTVNEPFVAQLRQHSIPGSGKLVASNDLGANKHRQRIATTESQESRSLKGHRGISANSGRGRQLSPETNLSIRVVNANDIFGTTPIEIQAAAAAEAERAAYGDDDGQFQNFLANFEEEVAVVEEEHNREGEKMRDSFMEGVVAVAKKSLRRSSCSITPDADREIYDEAARDLQKPSTAKAFSDAITARKKRKQEFLELQAEEDIRQSQERERREERLLSAARVNDTCSK